MSATPHLRFILQIHRATHRIGLGLDRLRQPRVTQGEAHVLAQLAADGSLTVAAIHGAFAHRRSTLTSILDRLEARGFVTRTVDAADRRSFIVALTPRGAAAARAVVGHLAAFEAHVLARVTARDLQGFLSVLSHLDAIDETPGAPARPRPAGASRRPAR